MSTTFVIMLSACYNRNEEDKPLSGIAVAVVDTTPDKTQESAVKDSIPVTSIKWLDSTFRDLGSLNFKDSALVSFRFKNTGTSRLL
ncbi:hypothetical protein [Niabella hibiscisoli]|uniref:hypothetical protein n=1 Tax=Niabella hibiscisoli TaxID=1825928 RepID=UPI001F0EC765|nr:hypothetical protein [Niabella hibiscisoli]MCH5718090.1 hypothetical protein [Niabella hibiscisoli]